MISHGTWGDREVLFQNLNCAVTLLTLNSKKRCSWHKHNTAFNLFYVVHGLLGIKTENGISKIMEGQSFLVQPGIFHEFQTYEEKVVAIEICYVEYNKEDIFRETLGGDLAK